MNLSELWLRELVNPLLTGPQIAAQLTMAGLEVDGLNPVAGSFDGVIVAKVLSTEQHPNADKLTLCEVDVGSGNPLKIVCGASNVRKGLMVALATIGANLPNDFKIKESMLRGQLSQGMLCSVAELGLEESSDGIMELSEDAPIGEDLRIYLNLDDQVFDIDLTPNRADCFSVLGLAREVAALNNIPLTKIPAHENLPKIDDKLTIDLEAYDACPKYCGRIIKKINKNAKTPVWIKERLRRSGIRAIHPVVDVINYVMIELGQPMHAFDLKSIDGGIKVRFGHEDEKLKLLDGQEIKLSEKVLVIASHNKPLALAGIMGGDESAVNDDTDDIFIESAFFNPLIISGVARSFSLSSDSSQRFERGVDPNLQIIALERATYLLQEIVGGELGPIVTAIKEESLPTKEVILFNPAKVKKLTGVDISHESMLKILKDLGMIVNNKETPWSITAPSYRFDIGADEDVVEEIIRLYGYDKLEALPHIADMQAGTINSYEYLLGEIGKFLSDRGYHETISYSFVDPALQQELYKESQALKLLNPISLELSEMRVGMWAGLIASMIYNIHRQQTVIKFFEAGVVFDNTQGKLEERQCIAGLITGQQGAFNWSEKTHAFDFYDMKGDIQALFASLNLNNVKFVAANHNALHPGKSARILLDNQELGWVGVLHPRFNDELSLSDEVILFELSLKPIIRENLIRYQAISKYPQIRRDLSLLVNNEVSALDIEQAVRDVVANNWLKSFDVFDLYIGESIPQGKKSLAISLTLQDDSRTLVDAEINLTIDAIIKKLGDEFSIILRRDNV